MENEGVPMDIDLLAKLRNNWDAIQDKLITEVDKEYEVFDDKIFKMERFEAYLVKNDIPWPRLESGIAAALSGDRNMLDAYNSGDSYLAFAKQAKAVPEDATKKSHGKERDLFKACVLGVQYGMEAESLAIKINRPVIVARNLLRLHREVYSQLQSGRLRRRQQPRPATCAQHRE